MQRSTKERGYFEQFHSFSSCSVFFLFAGHTTTCAREDKNDHDNGSRKSNSKHHGFLKGGGGGFRQRQRQRQAVLVLKWFKNAFKHPRAASVASSLYTGVRSARKRRKGNHKQGWGRAWMR